MPSFVPEITALSDGVRSSVEIAEQVGLSPRYVRRLMLRYGLPQRAPGAKAGALNHQFVSGRRIDFDGYVLVTVPSDHPHARSRTHRATKLMYEHRHVMEQTLQRYLAPEEVVDHRDGLTLHNAPANLKVYPTNADHLRKTLAGRVQRLSQSGKKNISERFAPPSDRILVDTHYQRRAAGDIRLHQILLTALSLGTDSPFLSGTIHHTKKAGIDMSSRSTIELALTELYRRWVQVLAR
jgi:hypothetical protein